jgi:hypothetical protein
MGQRPTDSQAASDGKSPSMTNLGEEVETRSSVADIGVHDIPAALERSEIPTYFRQFQNAAVLKKLAHSGKGPLIN